VHLDRCRFDHRDHYVGEESETFGEWLSANPQAQRFTTQTA